MACLCELAMMVRGIFLYLLQFVVLAGLLLLGFHVAEMNVPWPVEAPWLWGLVALAPLLPGQWSGWDGSPQFWPSDYDPGD
ncbi:hypothetical protein [Aeoliella sp. SH292]|uniref:hypothetical protein n=1 Tax=Aeoliella sp. SH292 TaxID=3454464 RepID=UPI003F9727D4